MREVNIENVEEVLIKTPVMDILFEVWSEGDHFEIRLPDSSMKFDDISLSRAEIKSHKPGRAREELIREYVRKKEVAK